MARSVRITTAGLMGVVTVVSVVLAALRSGSHVWAGAVFLLTCGVIALAAVGSVLVASSARAWWLGFVTFGGTYLVLAFYPLPGASDAPGLPTETLLRCVMPYVGPGPDWQPGFHSLVDNPYLQTEHCLCGLLAGSLVGALAYASFGSSRVDTPPPGATGVRRYWRAVLGLLGIALVAVTAIAGARKAPALSAGVTVLLTWWVVGLAACGPRSRRAACLGAALFGAGYLLLVAGLPVALLTDVNRQPWPQLATNRLLNAVRPWLPAVVREYPAGSDGVAAANARILRALDQTVPVRFRQGTTLRDLLAYVVSATHSPDRSVIPVYVDPNALRDADASLETTVTIDLERVPLRTSLDLALGQLSLTYTVRGGVLVVNDEFGQLPVAGDDPFLSIGQSLFALLAAWVGGLTAASLQRQG